MAHIRSEGLPFPSLDVYQEIRSTMLPPAINKMGLEGPAKIFKSTDRARLQAEILVSSYLLHGKGKSSAQNPISGPTQEHQGLKAF